MNELLQIANRANNVADNVSRGLLMQLLPEERFRMAHLLRPSPDSERNVLNMIESGIAYISDISKRTVNWTRMIDERRQQEKVLDDRKKARVTRARNMFQRLDFESLIPYYLDYKKRGAEYALTKWSESLPIQKVKVKIIPDKQSGPQIIRIPFKKVEEKEEKKA
jgi:hypothetical protein